MNPFLASNATSESTSKAEGRSHAASSEGAPSRLKTHAGPASNIRFWDNPVAHKDAGSLFGIGWLALFMVLPLLVSLLIFPSFVSVNIRSLGNWGNGIAEGRGLLFTLVSLFVFFQAAVLPITAATAIASERDRGTWASLLTTSLSGWEVVIGKALAAAAAPLLMLLVMAPVFALTGWAGDVSATLLGLLLGFCVLHGVAQVAVGILAGAASSSVKNAVGYALALAGGVLSLPLFFSFTAFMITFQRGPGAGALVIFTVSVLWALLVTMTSLVIARSLISPRAAPRRRLRTAVLIIGTSVFPMLLLLSIAGPSALGLVTSGPPHGIPHGSFLLEIAHLVAGAVLVLTSLGVVVEVAACKGASGHALDAPSATVAMRRALIPVGAALLLLACESALLFGGTGGGDDGAVSKMDLLFALLKVSGTTLIFLAGVAGVTALVSVVVQRPLLRCIFSWGGVATLLVLPIVVVLSLPHGMLEDTAFSLMWLNPWGMASSASSLIELSSDVDSTTILGVPAVIAGPIFWGIWAALGARFGPR